MAKKTRDYTSSAEAELKDAQDKHGKVLARIEEASSQACRHWSRAESLGATWQHLGWAEGPGRDEWAANASRDGRGHGGAVSALGRWLEEARERVRKAKEREDAERTAAEDRRTGQGMLGSEVGAEIDRLEVPLRNRRTAAEGAYLREFLRWSSTHLRASLR